MNKRSLPQESQTRRHVIPVHYEVGNESDSLEQLDQQRQVTVRDSRVSDDAGKSECEAKVSSDSLKSKRKCASGSSYLPIIRKGLFSEDHFFENVRQNYSEAVKEVLESANEWSCERDAMQVYRNLRQRNLQVENQAFSVTEDEHTHKVVMDVHDFTSGDVTVSLVGGSELVIEGQAEKQEGSCSARKSFCRRFLLPELVERDAISSALSSDGILSVISSKRGKSDAKASSKGFSSETKTRLENKTDSGHSWEEKDVAESLKESDGHSVRTFASSSRAHHHHSYTNHF
nr:protein lethal(2)essential for life-like [Penaeus vannamei]